MVAGISSSNATTTAWQVRATTDHAEGAAGANGRSRTVGRPSGPPPGPPPGGPRGLPAEATSAAAKALGLTDTEVTDALANGSSLADLAKGKGVDLNSLIDAVAQGLSTGGPGQGRSTEELTQVATHMVNGDLPPVRGSADRDRGELALRSVDTASSGSTSATESAGRARHHHAASSFSAADAPTDAKSLSDKLGIDVTSLLEQLRQGTHVSDIAAQQGTSAETLFSNVLNGVLLDQNA